MSAPCNLSRKGDHIMFKELMVVAAAALLAAAGPVSFAKGGGGGHAGGTSAEHMSNQGMAHEKANQAHGKHKPGKTTRAPDRK